MEDYDISESMENPELDSSGLSEVESLEEGYSLKRLSFKGLMLSVLAVLNFEKGILFTIKELIIRPKAAIEEYLKKDRTKLVNPVRFVFFSTAIATYLMFSVMPNGENNFAVSFSAGSETGINDSDSIKSMEIKTDTLNIVEKDSLAAKKQLKIERSQQAGKEFAKLVKQSSDKLSFALIFFFALCCLLFFRSNGYNFSEHLIINTFLICMYNVFTIILIVPTYFIGGDYWAIIISILGFIYFIYFWMTVFERRSVGGFFRCLLNYIISYLFFGIVFAGLIAIYFLIKMS